MKSNTFSNCVKYEFHISREIRNRYQVNEELFSITGNLLFTNPQLVRDLVNKMNNDREDIDKIPFSLVNAAGLLDEVFHYVFRYYEEKINQDVFNKAVRIISGKLGIRPFKVILSDFVNIFPPCAVYKNLQNPEDYLNSKMYSKSNLEVTLEELIILHLDNFNPAYNKIKEFFNENLLKEVDLYKYTIHNIEEFFRTEKKIKNDLDIISFLKQPILYAPDNVDKQLEFVLENWKEFLPNNLVEKILKGRDYIKEEFGGFAGVGGEIPTIVPQYKDLIHDELSLGRSRYKYAKDSYMSYSESENFTPDIHWMPRVVLLAKNIYVWLDQLSKKYQKVIRRLDQIPDEELDRVKNWNINSIWLIGVWERSTASKKIKNIMGNPDAISSAYSLYDYQIANDLGGENAYEVLDKKCKVRGIRLASDMVPNHTGIYSKWMIENPDYFIQTKNLPFPGYKFTGADISENPDIEIKIEDGYFNHSDASVVFRRVDKRTNDIRYIYHGNDGTNMAWNDTAQLDLLKSEVREAVIQEIFRVARKFSIIRFDAAMTLAKKHFQRLWYPLVGSGGDIPSRVDYSMYHHEFDNLFPKEFWREVVDRINDELPNTLLLAEAFWLMEGYFVRTLGMHRVYNSAFMNMLMREENFKYKQLIKNTLEFEPEILKRYVNFMSNPDEETAIRQFGTGDKYFGICMLMITLPGMPMFAHGQIEGFTEKYGMEYQRSYYNELPNQDLINRHEREIFPLTAIRYLFSEVQNFWLFDFYVNENTINENVFAYTNCFENKKVLVLYNNKYDSTKGFVKKSAQKLIRFNENDKNLTVFSLSDAMGLKKDINTYYICREFISGREYLINPVHLEKEGLKVSLKGFEYKVFMDFIEVYDTNGEYEKLYRSLKGKPVESVLYELEEMKLEDVLKSVNDVLNEHYTIEFIKSAITNENNDNELAFFISNFNNSIRYLFYSLDEKYGFKQDNFALLAENEKFIKTIKHINDGFLTFRQSYGRYFDCFYPTFKLSAFGNYFENSLIYLISRVLINTQKVLEQKKNSVIDYFQKLHLNKHIYSILKRTGRGDWEINQELNLINLIVNLEKKFDNNLLIESLGKVTKTKNPSFNLSLKMRKMVSELLNEESIKEFIQVNEYKNVVYYRKENFEEMLDWFFSMIVIRVSYEKIYNSVVLNGFVEQDCFLKLCKIFEEIKTNSNHAEYRYELLLEGLK